MASSKDNLDAHLPAEFIDRYQPADIPGLPKYAQLREALLAAIDDGYWAPGQRIPNEAVIAASTPYSLGTVQKALNELVQTGVVIRHRGRGSFVAARHGQMSAPLHLRFEDEMGTSLPVFPRIVSRYKPGDDGLAAFLGTEVHHILRIDRVFRVGSIFSVFTSIYLDYMRFPIFEDATNSDLETRNFKNLIRRKYNIAVHRITQSLALQPLPDDVRTILQIRENVTGCKLDLRALGAGGRGIYYQRAFIPPNPCTLRLSNWQPGS